MSSSEDEELFDVSDEVISEQRALEESFANIEADNLKAALELSHAEQVDQVKSNVTDKVNSIFGDELSNLCKVNHFQEELLAKLDDLDNKLDVANTETPSQLHESLRKGDEIRTQINDINQRKEELSISSNSTREAIRNFCVENTERLSELGVVRGVAQYWVWLQLVDNISTELVLATETGTPSEMVTSFTGMRELESSLAESRCGHLKEFVSRTTNFWKLTIQTKLVTELEEALQSLGWPFVQLGDSKKLEDITKSVSIQELQELVKNLILIQDKSESDNLDNMDDMSVTHPMRIMLKPLRKRFKFHFLGTKTTNNPAKPEWFTTQLTLWASLHKTFLEANIQPVYDELELSVPAKMEFGYGLVSLAREKLEVDLPLVFPDDVLLAHTIDEAISLTRELTQQLEYSSAQPSPLSPLTSALVFSRWLNMERKFAFEKLDKAVCEEGAWQSEVGDQLVPAAAQSFLSVLLSVTERYKFLKFPEHRLQFLELQTQLLEDFRVRLVQLVRSEHEEPLESNFCPIIVTVHHLIEVLRNWAETPFFLQLEFQKCEAENKDMSGTVFDDAISKFEYLLADMISTIITSVMFSIRSNSRHYRKEVKWFSLNVVSESVHPAFCNILQDVAFYLETMVKIVPENVFTRIWRELATEVGKFICEDVILVNSFNSGGARQLQLDVTHGLLPIFGEFTSCPQAHFPVLMDCLKLLNTSAGSLILSLDTLQSPDTRGGDSTLRELGVRRLTVEQAVAVINTRVDLTV